MNREKQTCRKRRKYRAWHENCKNGHRKNRHVGLSEIALAVGADPQQKKIDDR